MRYQNKRPKRHFIAGAVCQQCKAADTTALNISYDEQGVQQEYISCAVCDFTEHRPSEEELRAMQAKKEQEQQQKAYEEANQIKEVKFKF